MNGVPNLVFCLCPDLRGNFIKALEKKTTLTAPTVKHCSDGGSFFKGGIM